VPTSMKLGAGGLKDRSLITLSATNAGSVTFIVPMAVLSSKKAAILELICSTVKGAGFALRNAPGV